LLRVKDVHLTEPAEVLEDSGYPVSGVPPFNKNMRILLDPRVQQNPKSTGGGGNPDKLIELETIDVIRSPRADTGRFQCLDVGSRSLA